MRDKTSLATKPAELSWVQEQRAREESENIEISGEAGESAKTKSGIETPEQFPNSYQPESGQEGFNLDQVETMRQQGDILGALNEMAGSARTRIPQPPQEKSV